MNEHEAREKRLDEMLDAALAEYGAVEPLRGLEERVLGRLRGAEARRPWWIWGAVAAAVAAVTIAIVLLGRPAERSAPVVVEKQPAVTAPKPVQPTAPVTRQPTVARAPVRHGAVDAQMARAPQRGIPALPKRDVFPTPGPPTSEELLLAHYMRVTPRDEVLAQINRPPLEFHEDPQAAPSTSTSPQKSDGTK